VREEGKMVTFWKKTKGEVLKKTVIERGEEGIITAVAMILPREETRKDQIGEEKETERENISSASDERMKKFFPFNLQEIEILDNKITFKDPSPSNFFSNITPPPSHGFSFPPHPSSSSPSSLK
jgi:hypothetical protein